MQNPTYHFIEDHENTMNPAATSSIMGFVDRVLNVRYGSYAQDKFDQLLDEFCQIAIGLALVNREDNPNYKPGYPTNKAELKRKIIEITQDRAYPKLLSAVYFDSEANGGKGASVTVTYNIPQIFNLVLAATLDDEIYKELGTDTDSEQLLKDRQARVRTLPASLFGGYRLGIAGRCNQGVRHELVGCLNGVYPKGPGERWYFIEDMQAAVGLQISDHIAKIVSYSIDSMTIKLESVLKFSLKEFWMLSEYAVDGTSMPVFIQNMQNALEPGLILWAKEHFVNPNSALNYFNLNTTNSIAAAITEHALKVPLFKAWDGLSAYEFSPYGYGVRLSAGSYQPAIEAVINWVTEQTADSLTKIQLNKNQIDNLITLERLLNDGPTLDLLDIFGVDLKEFGIRLSTLFNGVDSIEKFWAVSFAEFDRLTLDIRETIDEWSNTCSSENLLWGLIEFKQGKGTQAGFTYALALFKRRRAQEPATWLAMRDIDLLVDTLGDPRIDDVLVWAIIGNKLPIVKYLTNSILNSGSKIVSPTHGLLSNREHVQAIADIAARISSDDACNLTGEVVVGLMQQMNKTTQDRAIIEKLMIISKRDGFGCLITAIKSANTKLALSIIEIIKELSNENDLLNTMLTQQNSGGRNCLMLTLEADRPEIARQIINTLLGQHDALNKLLTQQGDRSWNRLMPVLYRKQPDTVAQIINVLLEQPDASYEILTQQDSDGRNCLMWALDGKRFDIAKLIIESLSGQPNVLNKLLTQRSNGGQNCLMWALINDQPAIAVQIIKSLSGQPDALNKLLTQQDFYEHSCQTIIDSDPDYSDVANAVEEVLGNQKNTIYRP